MGKGFFGNAAGPSPAKLYAYVEFRTTTQEEGRAWVQYKRACKVESDFKGTVVDRTWGGQLTLYGAGWYGDSGWQNYGWVSYGQYANISAAVSYTGYSGTYYRSYVNAYYSPDIPTWAPNSVTGVSVSLTSQGEETSQIKVSWKNDATSARPYAGIYVDVSIDGGDYNRAYDCSGLTNFYPHTADNNHVYRFRVIPHNSAGNANAQYTSTIATVPTAPTSASVSRTSDTQNIVSFIPASTYTALYSSHIIQRQIDGGAWSSLGLARATSIQYIDRTTSANHFYRYRIRSYNSAGSSDWTYTGTVYNTPCAPNKPKLSRISNTQIKATFTNDAKTATHLEIQRSSDNETWTVIKRLQGLVTSFEDDPGNGTFYYRIRNIRASLTSSWVYSDAIVTIAPPSAPTLISPSSSLVISKTQANIAIKWQHNPTDGSAQTAAQWRYCVEDSETWTTSDIEGSTSSATLANDFAINTKITVQVRTKGIHADYSPWSSAVSTYIRQVPSVAISEVGDDFTIEKTPVHVEIAYSDPSGTIAAGTLTIYDESGASVYSCDLIEKSLEFDIPNSEWLPSNDTTYTVSVSVRSSSTLQATTNCTVAVSYILPSVAIADIVPDPLTGYVSIAVREGRTDSNVSMEYAMVWRNVDGVRTLLGNHLYDDDVVVDKYAPLNTEYTYETVSVANSGAINEASFAGRVSSSKMFVYWSGGIASGMYNPEDDFSLEPEFSTFQIAGKKYPVVVVGETVEEPHSVTLKLRSREEAMSFYNAIGSCEPMIFKTLYGFVFYGIATAQFTPSLSDGEGSWEISLDITRVDGDAL